MRIYQHNGHTNIAMSVAEVVDLSSKLLRAAHGVVEAGIYYVPITMGAILQDEGKPYPSSLTLVVEHEKIPRSQKKPAKKRSRR